MRYLLVLLVALSLGLASLSVRRRSLADAIEHYVDPPSPNTDEGVRRHRWRFAGVQLWMACGGMAGVLLAQGDLFLSGTGRSPVALGVLGAATGFVLHSMRSTALQERLVRHVRYELPIIADALALQIVAGESVGAALRTVGSSATGDLPMRIRGAMEDADEGGLDRALAVAASVAIHADERRLYEVLGHAHVSGGRTGEGLAALAEDFRASLERDITEQGGKKAVAAYGPVLALMVPTALAFLLYPTLVGLQGLAGTP